LGAASAVIPPALAALSLGIVGRELFPARVSRNESFNHGGNFAAAILTGTIGQRFGYQWIFYLVCLFALASAAAVTLIRPQEIDHDIARGGEDKASSTETDKNKKGHGDAGQTLPPDVTEFGPAMKQYHGSAMPLAQVVDTDAVGSHVMRFSRVQHALL